MPPTDEVDNGPNGPCAIGRFGPKITNVPETSHRAARNRGRHRKNPLQADAAPLLEVVGVTAHVPGGRILLDDVSFSVQRGWLVAVVGPTGAGKTSLARALTGGLALDQGQLRLDGQDLASAGGRDRIAFVPQDDVLHGQLGLGRTLRYAASLRVRRSGGGEERAARVDAALHELGLQHHTDVAVSSLSGGQRKRANIAAELVGHPEVLVLDEPTSGLDPGYEKSVMTTLRQIADAGRTVIAVTHSMQALHHCDRVLYLAEGGRVAYFGPPARAAAYFGAADAADVFLALDTEPGQAWKERFRAHPAYARYVSPMLHAADRTADRLAPWADPALAPRSDPAALAPSADPDDLDDVDADVPPRPERSHRGRRRTRPSRPGWPSQVLTLVRRNVALLRSDRRHLALLALQGPLLGLLLRQVLRDGSLVSVPGTANLTAGGETVAMFVALSATWLGASNTIREIVKERHILRREVDAGLAPSAYVVAKGLVLGSLAMAQSAVLAVVACSGQQPPAHGGFAPGWVELAAIGALVGLAAASLGLLLSGLVSSPDKALAVLPMTLVTELVLAGGWAATVTTPGLSVLRSLTGAHWGVAAIGASVAGDSGVLGHAVLVLGTLALAALVATWALVRRHTRPADSRGTAARIGDLRAVAEARAGSVLGTAAACVLLVSIGVVATGMAGPGSGGAVVATAPGQVAAPAGPAQPATTATAPTTPEVAAPAVLATPATAVPTTTVPVSTTAAPTTTTPTTLPTTTSTVYAAPAPSGGTGLPSGQVTTASNSAVPWWSPWYWFAVATGQGG